MAILSDAELRRIIEERNAVYVDDGPEMDLDLQIGPSSVDLRLGYSFGILNTRKVEVVDTRDMEKYQRYIEEEEHTPEEGVIIHPGEFILGSSLETLKVPEDKVARVEGRSSYGRLGIVVHASLPFEEEIFFWTEEEGYHLRPIGEIVENEVEGEVVGFDREGKTVDRYPVTDWIENPQKDIYRVETRRGRSVKVTEDHNLFTVDENGDITKIETGEAEGTMVAIPQQIPSGDGETSISLTSLFHEHGMEEDIMAHGSGIVNEAIPSNQEMVSYYAQNDIVPLSDLPVPAHDAVEALSFKQSDAQFTPEFRLSPLFTYVAGFFIAEGYRRRKQLQFPNTNNAHLDKIRRYFARFDINCYENTDKHGCHRVTVSSAFLSRVFEALGLDEKRISPYFFNLPEPHLAAMLQGLVDGDASVRDGRVEYYTADEGLANDVMYLCRLLGIPSSLSYRERAEDGDSRDEYRVEIRRQPHKLLQYIPVPSTLLRSIREGLDLTAPKVAEDLGYSSKNTILNPERREYDSIKRETLQRLADYYKEEGESASPGVKKDIEKLHRLAYSDLLFDNVEKVEHTGRHEVTYDLEVQPKGKKIENFLGGRGGIFLSNTAGFVDPGFEGQITLEMQNLGNAPVKLYPEDRICQVVFETMTSEADTPYGDKTDAKYQGQSGATGSKLDREKR